MDFERRFRHLWGLPIIGMSVLFSPVPGWAFLDGIIAGARAVKDQAHQRIMENQMIQLVIEAKRNYDASVKIYREVRRLNEGKGLVKNIASDLGKEADRMTKEEKEAFDFELAYRNDSGLDRGLEKMDEGIRRGIERRGVDTVNEYSSGVNKKSELYARAFQDKARSLWERKKRGEAGREEGVKVALGANDLTSKAMGLELQEASDAVGALNELLLIETMRDAQGKKSQIEAEREIADALRFLADKKGMARVLEDSFFNVRLSRAPALFYGTRRVVSRLVAALLALFLAAGFLYEYSRTGGFLPEVLGLPLVLVVFGLAFYDKIFSSFAILMDTMEQTIVSGTAIVNSTELISSSFSSVGATLQISSFLFRYLSIYLGYFTWGILIVFLWVRFAFFCLLYAVGPLLIVCALFQPLRALTQGWMMASVQVGLWGIFMRILVLVVENAGISSLAGGEGGVLKSAFMSLMVNLIFLVFAVIAPYFTHLIVSGHIAEKGVGIVGAAKGGLLKGYASMPKLRWPGRKASSPLPSSKGK